MFPRLPLKGVVARDVSLAEDLSIWKSRDYLGVYETIPPGCFPIAHFFVSKFGEYPCIMRIEGLLPVGKNLFTSWTRLHREFRREPEGYTCSRTVYLSPDDFLVHYIESAVETGEETPFCGDEVRIYHTISQLPLAEALYEKILLHKRSDPGEKSEIFLETNRAPGL